VRSQDRLRSQAAIAAIDAHAWSSQKARLPETLRSHADSARDVKAANVFPARGSAGFEPSLAKRLPLEGAPRCRWRAPPRSFGNL
jgi:hypothetical protein